MGKIKEITKKLLSLGFNKQVFNKPKKTVSDIDFIIDLSKKTGVETSKAKEISDEFLKTLLNDYVPEISFVSDELELEFYIKKNIIEISVLQESESLGKCGIEVKKVLPFIKNISIDDFYRLFIEKDYDIELILKSGSN